MCDLAHVVARALWGYASDSRFPCGESCALRRSICISLNGFNHSLLLSDVFETCVESSGEGGGPRSEVLIFPFEAGESVALFGR